MFEVLSAYTKNDIYKILAVPEDKQKGHWNSGYIMWRNDLFLFVNVGIPGRTGHNYNNYWDGNDLHWQGKTGSHLKQNLISKMLDRTSIIHVFTREKDKAPFIYEGVALAKEFFDRTPVEVIWQFQAETTQRPETLPEELDGGKKYNEGKLQQVFVNKYERDPQARRDCINHFKPVCAVCEFDFEKVFGELGRGFIHVHHKKPLSEIRREYVLDPIIDLIPVCPNCHCMLHRKKPAYSIEELKDYLAQLYF